MPVHRTSMYSQERALIRGGDANTQTKVFPSYQKRDERTTEITVLSTSSVQVRSGASANHRPRSSLKRVQVKTRDFSSEQLKFFHESSSQTKFVIITIRRKLLSTVQITINLHGGSYRFSSFSILLFASISMKITDLFTSF